jgi:opacity protein-like surface antigen
MLTNALPEAQTPRQLKDDRLASPPFQEIAKMLRTTLAIMALLAASSAQAQDWTGPYAGLGIGKVDGTQNSGAGYALEGTPVSLFGGYNWQNGNLVFGGELALHSDDITLTAFPSIEYKNMIDLKGRLGYGSGRTLVYGVLGVSKTTYENGGFTDDLDGFAYGLGAEFLVSDKIFAGAEYLRRDFDHSNPGVTTDISTFSLRVGIKF